MYIYIYIYIYIHVYNQTIKQIYPKVQDFFVKCFQPPAIPSRQLFLQAKSKHCTLTFSITGVLSMLQFIYSQSVS